MNNTLSRIRTFIIRALERRKLIVACIAFIVLLSAAFARKGVIQRIELSHKLRDVKSRHVAITAERDSLESYLRDLRTNHFLQEKLARERFGMIREGEIVYSFPK